MNPAVKFMSRALNFFPVQKDCKNLSIKYESSFLTLKSQEYKKEHCKKQQKQLGIWPGKKIVDKITSAASLKSTTSLEVTATAVPAAPPQTDDAHMEIPREYYMLSEKWQQF